MLIEYKIGNFLIAKCDMEMVLVDYIVSEKGQFQYFNIPLGRKIFKKPDKKLSYSFTYNGICTSVS